MSDDDNTFGSKRWNVLFGMLGAYFAVYIVCKGLLDAFKAEPWCLGVLTVFWMISALCAFVVIHDDSRQWLAGFLEQKRFGDAYHAAISQPVRWLWSRMCRPLAGRSGWRATTRAVMTRRVFDVSLIIALAYPVLLPLGTWLATGVAMNFRSPETRFLPKTPLWPDRTVAICGLAIVVYGIANSSTPPREGSYWSFRAGVLFGAYFLAALWLTLASWQGWIAADAAVAVLGVGAVAVTFAVAVAVTGAVAVAGVGAVAGAVSGAVAVAVAGAVPAAVAGVVACAVPVAVAIVFERVDRYRPFAARLFLVASVAAIAGTAAWFVDWKAQPALLRFFFVFFGVFPVINGLFDAVSYGATLALVRLGLDRGAAAWLLALADIAIAGTLFLLLGYTLVLAVVALSWLNGSPIITLLPLFEGLRDDPLKYWWLWAMVFSTLVPTGTHVVLASFSMFGIRQPIARLVERADGKNIPATVAAPPLVALAIVGLLAGMVLVGWTVYAVLPETIDDIAVWYRDRLWILAFNLNAL